MKSFQVLVLKVKKMEIMEKRVILKKQKIKMNDKIY